MATTKQPPRRIEYMRLDEVTPALRNAKSHVSISGSLKRFGFADAAVLDERTMRLVAGHGRREELVAAKEQGQDPPEGVVVADDGEWMMPVQRGWASRSDEDADALGVALNRFVESGGWDERALAEMLDEFADADPDLLPATGFNQDDLDDLLARFGNQPDLEDLADQFGEPKDDELWPRLSLALPRDMLARYRALTEGMEGEDHDKFGAVVAWAEQGKQ
jgi:hypothetical protein